MNHINEFVDMNVYSLALICMAFAALCSLCSYDFIIIVSCYGLRALYYAYNVEGIIV